MKVNCVVVDDEQLARELIVKYCEKVPFLEVVGVCKNAMEVMEVLEKESVDLLFLDIQMPDLTGIELLGTLSHKPQVIFTTAYSEYALKGYELDVVDYLLKPINFERFVKAVNKVKISVPSGEKNGAITEDFIMIKSDHKIYRIKYDKILYVEGLREYVAFYTKESKIVTLASLKGLESKLPDYFIRVHKSFIVNKNEIKSLYGNQLELASQTIPIGKSYKEVVNQLFDS